MKKIMILGAGVYQVPLIETAKKRGLFTIVVSIPGDYPGFTLADKVYYIDTTDKEAVLATAKEEKVEGICTTGTDVAVATIGYVCERLGLSGLSEAAAVRTTDKAAMKDAFLRGGVCSARFRKVCNLQEAEKAAEELGFPVVVKRVDSSGSRGITIVKEPLALEQALFDALEFSNRDYALVEEFTKGEEIGVDGVVQKGKLVFCLPHEKLVYHGSKITVPAGHGFPYHCSENLEREIRRQVELGVAALGLDNCSVNADIFVDFGENGWKVSVIEMGGRTGATCIPELISISCGFDFYEKILDNALGIPVEFKSEKPGMSCMAKLLMSPVHGVITRIDEFGLDVIRSRGNSVAVDFPVGHEVEAMENGTNRIGHVIASVENRSELEEIVNEVDCCIFIDGHSLEELWRK